MHIKVTEDHIRRGKRRTMRCCPIALAIRDLEPNRNVDVLPQYAYIGYGDATRVCDLPQLAQDFIIAFDAGNEVTPIEFDTECRPLI
jgi:hypothetical protein